MIEDDFPVIKLAPDNTKKINRERKKKKKSMRGQTGQEKTVLV